MKYIFLLVFGFYNIIAQEIQSYEFNNITLQDALLEIALINDVDLVIEGKLFREDFVKKNYLAKTLTFILSDLLKKTDFSYSLNRKELRISKRAKNNRVFSGFVINSENSEALYQAYVYLENEPIGTVTNNRGYFTIRDLYPVKYKFKVQYIGYAVEEVEIDLSKDLEIRKKIALNPKVFKNKNVVIVGDTVSVPMVINTKSIKVDAEFASQSANLIEPDLFRNIIHIAGIQPIFEPLTGFSIRGNPAGDNLILLDGVEMHAPYHLGKIFSAFNMMGLRDYEVFKDDVPLKFADRVSGVVNVHTKEGNRERFEGKLHLNLLTASTSLEGPIGKGAYFFSLKRSIWDMLVKEVPYYMYDFHGKVYQDFDQNNRLTMSAYKGHDDLREELIGIPSTDLEWGNQIYSLNWRKIFNSKLFMESTISYSEYTVENFEEPTFVNSLYSTKLLIDFNWNQSRKHQINFGYRAKYMNITLPIFQSDSIEFHNYSDELLSHKFYIEDEYSASRREIFTFGFGVNYYRFANRFVFDPKISYIRRFSNKTELFIDIRRTYQNDFLLSDSNLKANSSILLTDGDHPLQVMNQFSLGGNFPYKDYVFDLRFYYRETDHLLRQKDNIGNIGDYDYDKVLESFDIESKGLELTVNKSFGSVKWQMMYTLSYTDEIFEHIKLPFIFDRRHGFTNVIDLPVGDTWTLNANYYTASPLPDEKVRIINSSFAFINAKITKHYDQSELYYQFHYYADDSRTVGIPTIGYQMNF